MYVFASLVEYACVSFEVNRRLKRGTEIPPLQPESDDGKVKATTDLIDCIFLCVISYTYQLNRDDVFLSHIQTPGKGQCKRNQALTTNIKTTDETLYFEC